ncbi:hypothetical protein [Haliscomenobacter sp.]|uniref:hypothetical protein n=1 Tax=Haliscomenobacter sp. TaxID=2717303 RepID=UPI003BA99AC1
MKLSNLFTNFHDHDSLQWIKVTFGANLVGVVGGWLAQNWYVFLGFVVASVIPMVMSWQKHNEELRHQRVMNEIEEAKAKKELKL